jgi:dTDP-4-amino-4,6-dideoxygalactose transaminase
MSSDHDPVPFSDLAAAHREVGGEILRGLERMFESSAYILGPAVAEFERAFAAFAQVGHCVGVASGTDALELSLRALGIGPGDEVILPANTFIATALAVARAGAKPVLVDCDERYLLLDPEKVSARVGPHTRAIMPVHLYGQLAPMLALSAIARQHDLLVVEDAAQAHGAAQDGAGPGAHGLAAAVSFYPAKNLGAYGDGGAVLTSSSELAAKVRRLRNYGGEAKYEHSELGFNSRLDALQALVLSAKLPHLAAWNDQRRAAARRYDELLSELTRVRRPAVMPGNSHVFHLYAVRVPERDAVLRELEARGIATGIHYPVPVHLQKAFRHLGHLPGDFPVAEKAAGELLSLPMFPQISAPQQTRVVEALRSALG